MPSVQKQFKRQLDSLVKVFDFIDQFVTRENVDDDAKGVVCLAVEELFTNMIKYEGANSNDISLELRVDGEVIIVQLVDHDVEPFDMTKRPVPDLGTLLKDRKPGGLGIFLTQKLVDDLQYQYVDRTSIITLKKNFRRKHV